MSNYNFKNKNKQMKKLFAIALIAASFTACNEGEKKAEETPATDTTSVVVPATTPVDTAAAAPAADTTAKPAAADTTKK